MHDIVHPPRLAFGGRGEPSAGRAFSRNDLAHLCALFFNGGANCAGVPMRTATPKGRSRELISGPSATAAMSPAIRSRRATGRSRPPKKPTTPSKVSSGNPASSAVGTSGAIGERCRFVTISSRALPLSTAGISISRRRHQHLNAIFGKILKRGAKSRYGTCVSASPALFCNARKMNCGRPAVAAQLNFSG